MDELFQKGLDYNYKINKGKTHLNLDGNTNGSKLFTGAKGVDINIFQWSSSSWKCRSSDSSYKSY